ncbi:MAG TPA: glycosyltransferase family protein [Candidatus Acidoferrales bacterium]|nr:glycosyltransferase family protein [Candidatus Acidoferrales bacterium]
MRIDATIQARTASTRLPGKVLKPILGKPMLALQVERIRQSRLIDRIILATTDRPHDDALEALARQLGIECFRGSEDDVLGRVVAALQHFGVELHVEFQGDNPMPDALLIDAIIGFYLKHVGEYDYVTNALKTTYPPGAEVSVYPARALIEAERHATDARLREHVGIHIYQHPERFRIHNIEAPPWLACPELHIEVDTEEDFKVVTAIFEHFYPHNPGFSLTQVIEFAHAQGLIALNRDVERRWRKFREGGA